MDDIKSFNSSGHSPIDFDLIRFRHFYEVGMNLTPDPFLKSYADCRESFRRYLGLIPKLWPSAQLNQRGLYQAKDLTIDWIESKATTEKKQVLIFTLGEHGIEGYVGSAMLNLFVKEFLPRLNPKDTGLVLIHAINPSVNPDYTLIDPLLNPKKPVN